MNNLAAAVERLREDLNRVDEDNAYTGIRCVRKDDAETILAELGRGSEDKKTIHASLAMQDAGAQVLFDKQFENSPWKGKIKLMCPKAIQEYSDVACNVYFAMERAKTPPVEMEISYPESDKEPT